MIILLKPNDIEQHTIFFCNKIPNTIYENSNFIKIKYSNNNLVLNNIYINIALDITKITYAYNKIKYYFDPLKNSEIILKLCNIENIILNLFYNKTTVMKIYKLLNQLNNGCISIHIENNNYSEKKPKVNCKKNMKTNNTNLVLKLSGIWQTNTTIGLTYKFMSI